MPRGVSLLAVLLALSCPVGARAHAVLLQTDPIANQRLDSAPGQIMLLFNERVEPTFNSLRVLDSRGRQWDGSAVRVEDGDTVVVSLPQLKDGPYGVFWRVTSLDGHQVQGQFGFGVRAEPPTEAELSQQVPQEQFVPAWYIPAIRGLELAVLSLWMGGISFLAIIFRPVAARLPQPDGSPRYVEIVRRSAAALLAGGVIFLLTEILWLWGKTAAFIGTPMLQAASWSALTAVITTTRLGEWWTVGALSALALLALAALWLRRGPLSERRLAGWAAGFALSGGAILASFAATSHAQAVSQGVLAAEAVDWVHLAATVVWIGGLIHLLIVLRMSRKRWPDSGEFLSRLSSRFSKMALYCVLALLATGIYNTWLHLPSWSSFVTSDYGRVLTTKLVLVLVILLLAAMNRQRVLPALRAFASVPEKLLAFLRRLQELVQAEVVLGVLILALVGLLTNLAPATTAVAAGPLNLSRKSGDFTVTLKIDPNKVGENRAVVGLAGPGGKMISDAKQVTVYLRSLDMDMGLETVPAQLSPDGDYHADVALTMAGQWLVTVEISPPQGDAFTTEFTIPTGM